MTTQRGAAMAVRQVAAARMPAAVQQRSMMGLGGGGGDVDEMQMEREKKEWAAKTKKERRQFYLNKGAQSFAFLGSLALFEYAVCVADVQTTLF